MKGLGCNFMRYCIQHSNQKPYSLHFGAIADDEP